MFELDALWLALAGLAVLTGGFAIFYRGLWRQQERDCDRLENTLLQ